MVIAVTPEMRVSRYSGIEKHFHFHFNQTFIVLAVAPAPGWMKEERSIRADLCTVHHPKKRSLPGDCAPHTYRAVACPTMYRTGKRVCIS
jgi:hypothetical protein